MSAAHDRLADLLVKASMAEFNRAAVEQGLEGPPAEELPAFAENLRRGAEDVLAELDDANAERIAAFPDDVIQNFFAGIAKAVTEKTRKPRPT